MKLIEKHKQLIAWYQKKLGLSEYGLLWLVFFKGVFVALVIERLIVHKIFDQAKKSNFRLVIPEKYIISYKINTLRKISQ